MFVAAVVDSGDSCTIPILLTLNASMPSTPRTFQMCRLVDIHFDRVLQILLMLSGILLGATVFGFQRLQTHTCLGLCSATVNKGMVGSGPLDTDASAMCAHMFKGSLQMGSGVLEQNS